MGGRVGLCNDLFEDCSAFTDVTACTLAKSPNVTLYTRGFSHFVTSMTAPIASGWSENCRVRLSPTGKRRLSTAHTQLGRLIAAVLAAMEATGRLNLVVYAFPMLDAVYESGRPISPLTALDFRFTKSRTMTLRMQARVAGGLLEQIT
jgi:hypothetical protein